MTDTPTLHRTAQIALICAWAETYPNASRPLRLHTLRRYFRLPELASTNDLSPEQCRDGARWLRDLREQPERRAAVLRKVAAELAPDAACLEAPASRYVTDAADNKDRALATLEDIGEADHFNRWRAGDAGNILLADSPEGKPRDVLAEYLKRPELQKIKTFLCPKLARADKLPAEVLLKLETSTVETWWRVCRVAGRVPQDLRDRYEILSWTWFQTAATSLQPRDGRKVQPTLADIERRLEVAADNEYHFRSPQDLTRWINAGEVMTDRPAAEKPDRVDEALAAFRASFYERDSIVDAWAATFGAGARFMIREVKR